MTLFDCCYDFLLMVLGAVIQCLHPGYFRVSQLSNLGVISIPSIASALASQDIRGPNSSYELQVRHQFKGCVSSSAQA
jgi:hypothetical protein